MNAIKKARKLIVQRPTDDDSVILSRLVLSLETDLPFNLGQLYALRLSNFELALEVLDDWRLDRYYIGKARLFDVSWQAHEMNPTPATGDK